MSKEKIPAKLFFIKEKDGFVGKLPNKRVIAIRIDDSDKFLVEFRRLLSEEERNNDAYQLSDNQQILRGKILVTYVTLTDIALETLSVGYQSMIMRTKLPYSAN